MKRKIFVVFVAVLAVCSVMPLSALAWDYADDEEFADYYSEDKDFFLDEPETSISGNASMTIGKEKDLSGYIQYRESYKDKNGDWYTEWYLVGTVRWASLRPEVVSINDKGVAVAHRAGTARITATGVDDAGIKRVQTIVVGVTSGAKSTPVNSFEISEGNWLDFRQVGELHSGVKDIRWASSSLGIASVDSAGLVLAHDVGRCTITASYTDENNAEQTITYQLRVITATLSNKTKNSTIILKPGDEIDVGKLYYPKYSSNVLQEYACTTGAKDIVSVDSLLISAKAAGSGSVSVRDTGEADEPTCHKLTIVVQK